MIAGIAMDTSTVIVLAAIALSEGIGRVPAGALVFRRALWGPWHASAARAPRERLQLVHWWPPWTESLVVPPRPHRAARLDGAALRRRLEQTARIRRSARVVGAITLVMLVLGIPASIGFAGLAGGLLAAGCAFAGQVALAVLGWHGLRRLDTTGKARRRLLAATVNPFAAPGVASKILAAATLGAPPLTVAHTLLGPDVWARWFRPRAYDICVASAPDCEVAEDLEDGHTAVVQVLARRPDMASDGIWCPRCAATYQPGFTTCAECNVALLAADDNVRPTAGWESAVPP